MMKGRIIKLKDSWHVELFQDFSAIRTLEEICVAMNCVGNAESFVTELLKKMNKIRRVTVCDPTTGRNEDEFMNDYTGNEFYRIYRSLEDMKRYGKYDSLQEVVVTLRDMVRTGRKNIESYFNRKIILKKIVDKLETLGYMLDWSTLEGCDHTRTIVWHCCNRRNGYNISIALGTTDKENEYLLNLGIYLDSYETAKRALEDMIAIQIENKTDDMEMLNGSHYDLFNLDCRYESFYEIEAM